MKVEELERQIREMVKGRKRLLVSIAGIPGSGKSTISCVLEAKIKDCIVIPMDGFHLYRKELGTEVSLLPRSTARPSYSPCT